MPDTTEGALNTSTAPPAEAPILNDDRAAVLAAIERDAAEDNAGRDAQLDTAPDTSESLNAGAAEGDTGAASNHATAATGAPAFGAEGERHHEKTVPYDRFHEVNEKVRALEPLAAWQPAVEAVRQLGYDDPSQFLADLAAQQQAAQQAAIAQQVQQQYDEIAAVHGEEAADMWRQAEVANRQTQALLAQVQQQAAANHHQQAVSAQFAAIADALPPDTHALVQQTLRETPTDYLPKAAALFKQIAQASANNAKVAYATAKGEAAAAPTPVGKGGTPAPVAAAAPAGKPRPVWEQSFSSLMKIGGRGSA